jgi:Glycosyl hydrolases family 25
VSAKKAVDFFVAELEKLGLGDYDAIAIDPEETDGLPPAKVAAWAAEVAALLEKRLGRVPLLYTYPYFALAGNCTGLGHLPLWISDPNHPAGHPAVPGPWKRWAIHRYSTQGVIDRDVANHRDLAAMQPALGKAPETVVSCLLSRLARCLWLQFRRPPGGADRNVGFSRNRCPDDSHSDVHSNPAASTAGAGGQDCGGADRPGYGARCGSARRRSSVRPRDSCRAPRSSSAMAWANCS